MAGNNAVKTKGKTEEALFAVKEVGFIAVVLPRRLAKEGKVRRVSERVRADAAAKRTERTELAAKLTEEKLGKTVVGLGSGALPDPCSAEVNTITRRNDEVLGACVRA
ncbi:hypothetical protein TraAM80_07245 [Trypanosoma rangeli]|uniref:Uncharacterized protein n=1 Tax=Trypanosoma rangeli TaxID=5698 RepID=A0A3R7KTK1_TRYRA|nr:uncharacterized protein TraAM80_07245 [Trypanosoma rangeli]RNF01095.1 hypothetical protein TraAM80_07245 [Trypanosoma rangeli]|eukprot:RNF01095.1 hypothetical protein TraAM80_07245 [Trypanosoma rangeli]